MTTPNRLADIRARLAASKSERPPLSMDSRDEDIEYLLRLVDTLGNENDELRLPPTKAELVAEIERLQCVAAKQKAVLEKLVRKHSETLEHVARFLNGATSEDQLAEACILFNHRKKRENADAARWRYVRERGCDPLVVVDFRDERIQYTTGSAADAAVDEVRGA